MHWFDAAVRRVPGHAPALGHLAEVDAALGAHGPAIDRLRPLTVSSDDPDYAATLAAVLLSAGRPQEAEQWRVTAAARYDELVARHPEAFAHHAADFWLTVGGDRSERTPAPRAGSREPLRDQGRTAGSRCPGRLTESARGCRHGAGAPGAPPSGSPIARLSCMRPSTAASW